MEIKNRQNRLIPTNQILKNRLIPDQPDPDPEGNNQPGDLSKGQDLTIHVNSNWEAVHNMEID